MAARRGAGLSRCRARLGFRGAVRVRSERSDYKEVSVKNPKQQTHPRKESSKPASRADKLVKTGKRKGAELSEQELDKVSGGTVPIYDKLKIT